MTFEPMDLKALTDRDLAGLLELFRTLAPKNRVAVDLFAIVETEMLSRHEPTSISEYPDDQLSNATAELASLVDHSRANGIPDDYPSMRFLLLNLTALVDEMERRGMVNEVQ